MEFLRSFKVIIVPILIFTSCSQIRSANNPIADSTTQSGQAIALGVFKNTEGQIINLDDTNYDATVLIFASDTCSTCAEEAVYWKNEFKLYFPKNILFVHYLLGGSAEDAISWKRSFNLTWSVLYHEEDDLYRKYCPAIITPCLLIYNKRLNQLTQSYKPLRKEEILQLTGEWK